MKKSADRKSLFLGWEGSGYDFHANCRMKTVRWTYLLNNLDKTRNIAFQLVLQNKLDWTRDLGSLYVSGKLPTYPSPKPTLSYICCCLLSALLFPASFFLFRTEYASHDVASSLDLSKDSHIVINISRITFTVLVSSVIVKKVLFRSATNSEKAMITETEFIHLLRRWFPTPFCLFTFSWRPRKKCARVSHGMAQFVLKVAHLAISMEPTPLLEKVSTYGLLPRLWLLMVYEKVRSSPSGQGLPHIKLCWVPPPPPPPCVSGLKAWN